MRICRSDKLYFQLVCPSVPKRSSGAGSLPSKEGLDIPPGTWYHPAQSRQGCVKILKICSSEDL